MPVAARKPSIKLPPQNIEAEQIVLGSILIDKNAIIRVADKLGSKDFYNPAHEKIFEAMLELHEKHQPVDIMMLTTYLKERDMLKDVGGSGYLADLTNMVSTASHVDSYAEIVREKNVRREMIKATAEISEEAFDNEIEFEELVDDVEHKILAITQKSTPKNFTHIASQLGSAYERIQQLHEFKGTIRGVTTGFKGLDDKLSGFQKSDLIILGARPSVGKTTLALDIARSAAKSGKSVGIFSLEMAREQIVDRLISSESHVPLWKLRTGRITDDMDWQMIQASLDKLNKVNIFIDDTPSPNVMQMRSMARRLQMEHGLDMIMVDYLQLIAPRASGGNTNMVQQITEISRGLKGLARELNVPVLALSQLSRGVDQRDNKTPKLSDLRESGSIEQDADVVLFIYRKDRSEIDVPVDEQNMAQVLIAKHRNGPLGAMNVRFDSERVSFVEIEDKFGEMESNA